MVPRPVALTSSESHSDVESSHIDGYRNENTQKTKIPAILSSREHFVPLNVTICLMMMCKGHETRVPSANIRDLHVQFDCDQMQTGYFRWFDGMSNAQNFPADVERSHYHRRNRSHRLQGKYVCVLVMEKNCAQRRMYTKPALKWSEREIPKQPTQSTIRLDSKAAQRCKDINTWYMTKTLQKPIVLGSTPPYYVQ